MTVQLPSSQTSYTVQWCVNPDHYQDGEHDDDLKEHRYNDVEIYADVAVTIDEAAANGEALRGILEAERMERT